MSALACVTGGGMPVASRLLAHVQMEMALAEVTRRRTAGVPPVVPGESVKDWPAYFAALGGRTVKAKRADLELPAPERTAQDGWPAELVMPTGAARLEKLAAELGWEARVTYARGYAWGVGTAQVLIHSTAVRLRHPESGRAGVALWKAKVKGPLKWAVDDAWAWSVVAFPRKLGVEELKAWMKEGS